IPFPEHDRFIGPRDPLPVRCVDVDGRAERVRELDHAAVEVRMTDGDRIDPAERLYVGDEVIVDVSDHVPQHVSRTCTNEQGAWADRGGRFRANAGNPRALILDAALMAGLGKCRERGPLLPAPADVLSLIKADRAILARFAILNPAGQADR